MPASSALSRRAILANRGPVMRAGEAFIARAMQRYLEGLQRRVLLGITQTNEAKSTWSGPGWVYREPDWRSELAILKQTLIPAITTTTMDAYDAQSIITGMRFDLASRSIHRVMDRTATRIGGISDTMRDSVRSVVEQVAGTDADYKTLADELGGRFRDWSAGRAMTVARTESAMAYNTGALANYEDSGLVEECEVFDGSECGWTEHDDPDLADGSTRTLEECDQYPIAHPNCLRAFGPVVAGAPSREQPEEPAPVEEPAPEPEPAVQGLPPDVAQWVNDRADPTAGKVAYGFGLSYRDEVARGKFIGTFDEYKDAVSARLQKEVDQAIPSIRRSNRAASKIIKEGRFKTQFETGRSSGAFTPTGRANVEREMFGYADDLDATQRPVYGYLRPAWSDVLNPKPGFTDNAQYYGDVVFDLNPATKSRMTVMMDDSLGSPAKATAATNVRWSSMNPGFAPTLMDPLNVKVAEVIPYAEQQVHGGLGLVDVARITFTDVLPGPETGQALKEAGFRPTTVSGRVWVRATP